MKLLGLAVPGWLLLLMVLLPLFQEVLYLCVPSHSRRVRGGKGEAGKCVANDEVAQLWQETVDENLLEGCVRGDVVSVLEIEAEALEADVEFFDGLTRSLLQIVEVAEERVGRVRDAEDGENISLGVGEGVGVECDTEGGIGGGVAVGARAEDGSCVSPREVVRGACVLEGVEEAGGALGGSGPFREGLGDLVGEAE